MWLPIVASAAVNPLPPHLLPHHFPSSSQSSISLQLTHSILLWLLLLLLLLLFLLLLSYGTAFIGAPIAAAVAVTVPGAADAAAWNDVRKISPYRLEKMFLSPSSMGDQLAASDGNYQTLAKLKVDHVFPGYRTNSKKCLQGRLISAS